MAKNKIPQENNSSPQENYYKINTKAVDRLVNADKIDLSKTTLEDPAKKYRSNLLDKIPSLIKTLIIKFWFFGAICFFIFWGLSLYIPAIDDMLIILSVALGMVTDILVNNILRFIEVFPGENHKWMMFPKKKFWTFFANIAYSFIIISCVSWLYNAINLLINYIKGTDSLPYFGVEPILFGIFCLGFDLLFIGIKRFCSNIINDAKNKVNKQ